MNGFRQAVLPANIIVLSAIFAGCAPIPAAPGFGGLPDAPGSMPGGGMSALEAAAGPPSTHPDLLQLSGVSHLTKATCGLITAVSDHIRNTLGMKYPCLEAKAPIKSITDPANLMAEASPAVQAAAKIKADEEQAPQKIKGLRYLASVGCGGCYPDVEEALIAGLDDCTEEVRYEAAKAIRDTVGDPCKFCKASACCGPAVRKKLKKVAYDIDTTGCFKEPSARVRRIARATLCQCGPGSVFDDIPEEGPEEPVGYEGVENADGPYDPRLEEQPTDQPPAPPEPPAPGIDDENTANRSTPASNRPVIQLIAGTKDSIRDQARTPTLIDTDSKDRDPARSSHPRRSDKEITWEQIMIDPTQFESVDRARQLIIYLRARARGKEKEVARPEFGADEISIERFGWTAVNELEWEEAGTQLRKMKVGGISPILTHENRWYLLRLLGRRPRK